LPLYTGDDGGAVFVSSDTWPGTGGVLGLTQAQIADAKARGVHVAAEKPSILRVQVPSCQLPDSGT
jgi:hypothetical protein